MFRLDKGIPTSAVVYEYDDYSKLRKVGDRVRGGSKLRRGFPIPAATRAPRRGKYPFAGMAIGDSFFVTGVARGTLASACFFAAKRLGFTFARRVEGDGIRVWRIPGPGEAAAPAQEPPAPAAEPTLPRTRRLTATPPDDERRRTVP